MRRECGTALICVALVATILIPVGSGVADAAVGPARVVGWGSDEYGEVTPPPGLVDVVQIEAMGHTAVARRTDGSVIEWGLYGLGEPLPADLDDTIDIGVGPWHRLAARRDGSVVTWGEELSEPVPAGLDDIVDVAAGGRFSIARHADGTVIAWGANDTGQTSVPAGLDQVIAIDGGFYHALALRADGTVVGWGQHAAAIVPPGLHEVVAISAGYQHSLALHADGTVTGWPAGHAAATPPPRLANVVAISGGATHSLALLGDGTVVAWGTDTFGPIAVPSGVRDVIAIAASYGSSLAVTTRQRTVAHLVGNATRPARPDQLVADHLTAGGWDTVLVDDNNVGSAAVQDQLAGYDLIVISSSVDVKRPGFEAIGALPVPIVLMEPYVARRLGLVAAGKRVGEVPAAHTIRITRVHPVTGNQPFGWHDVATTPTTLSWYIPVPAAAVVANSAGSSARAVIFAVESGVPLAAGRAPARRVGFMFAHTTPFVARPVAWQLLLGAANWAAGPR